MFRNKADVDRHVQKTLAKVKSEKDRDFRSYSFARLYFDVGDYDSCAKYVEMYLNVKDNNPAALTLLGQAYQKLGQVERALAAYKTSLGLDPNQSHLIPKVCEMLGSNNCTLEPGAARYWAERCASAFPDHPALFSLRARLLSAEGAGAPATAALLKSETSARPRDPVPHARLLRHLHAQAEAPDQAFKYAFQNYERFADSIVWNEAVAEILLDNDKSDWEPTLLRLIVSERLAELSLAEGRRPAEAAAVIWKFDRTLFKAAETIIGAAPTRTLGAEAVSFFGAQLCLHLAMLLLKKAGREAGEWREAVRAAAPLLLLALQPPMPPKAPPPPSSASPAGSSERLLSSWYLAAAYRRSQAGHTLRACTKDKKNVFVEKISQYCSGAHWRDKLYRKVFTSKEHLEKMSNSFLLTNSNLAEVNLSLPPLEDMKQIDKVAALLKPSSLHYQTWLGSNARTLADVNCVGVDELRISVNNLSNCGAETLNKLDLDTFLYCSVLSAKKNLENEYKNGYWDSDRPKVLPTILTSQLCNAAQAKWWEAACSLHSGAGANASDSRLTLTRGIETIRCVGSHGLDPELLVEIARVFSQRAEQATDSVQRRFLEMRANLCYGASVPLLERIRNNISIRPPEKRLFEYTHGELPQEKLEALIEEGKLYLAVQCVNDKDDDKAIEILETVQSPYASFQLYKIYKKLAGEMTPERERSDPEKRTRRALYLTKAREFIFMTTDRLKMLRAPYDHPLYIELEEHVQSIEKSYSQIQSADRIQTNENNLYSSGEESWHGNIIARSSVMSLTPRPARSRHHMRMTEPSPESLEAQIRQLQRKDSVMSEFIEQTRVLVESNRTLVDEVREMKNSLREIKSHNIGDTVNQFRSLKLSVDEVKNKINEYRDESAADVADLKREITELKNELGKIKSSPVERPQMDENELYMLEEEAGAYLQRQQAAPVLPAQAYPMYPPGALYPLYGQYPGMPQLFPGALFQDQPLYSELLAQRTLAAPQPLQPPLPAPLPVSLPAAVPAAVPLTQQVPPSIGALPVHDYHIPLPQKTTTVTTSTPSKPFSALTTELANNSPKPFSPFDSFKAAQNEAAKPFSFLASPGTFDVSAASQNQSVANNKSRTLSERSTDSYDPIPDFKPIINLPDEVAVITGEEGEEVLFDARAKLFRFVTKEWKERGLGQIKLLRNETTGKVRVLMRRERVLTICANHLITPEIEINPMKDRDKAYTWAANDFADQTLAHEVFCIRFKTVETGNEFYEKFCVAITESAALSSANNSSQDVTQQDESKTDRGKATISQEITVGGLKFFNTPTFKTVPDSVVPETTVSEPTKPNPFAGFTFNKNSTSTLPTDIFAPPKETVTPKTELNLDENVLYESQVNVSMTDKNSMLYKDKGPSKVKIFAPKKDSQKVKLIVYHEKEGKIFCDIPLKDELKYDELMLQPNTLILVMPEAVSVRITFPSIDLYQKFKFVSSTAHTTSKDSSKKSEKKQPEKPAVTSVASAIPTLVSGWGDKFKAKAGSWDCKSCYINNSGTDYCVACDSPKDPSMPKKENKPAVVTAPTQKFTFGIPATTNSMTPSSVFGNVQQTPNPAQPVPAASIFGNLSQSSATKSNVSFTFGIPAANKTEMVPKNDTISISSAAKPTVPSLPQKNTFEFSLKPKSPAKHESSAADKSQDSDNEYAQEDDGDHIKFTPIIPLPDKVEVKTGEEEEEVVYKHLAKLYRFASGEWKECGVGDIKILRHPDTMKVRVLMRREPIHKICLNHALVADLAYMPKDDKTWLFSANDFSSGEIVPTQFCVRFKTQSIAQEFLAAIEKAKATLVSGSTPNNTSQKDDDEVIFVQETAVSNEDKELAKKYLLPENFYAYKQKDPCKGCVGCKSDDYVFPVVKVESQTVAENVTQPEDQKQPEKPAPNQNAFVFGQKPAAVTNTVPAPVISAPSSVFSKPATVFGGASIFSGKGESASIFSGKQPSADKKVPVIAEPKFTCATETPVATPANIFGGQPLFSNAFSTKVTNNLTPVFGNVSTTNPASTFGFNTTAGSGLFGTPKDPNSVFKAAAATTTPASTASPALLGSAVFSSPNAFSMQPTSGSIFGGKGDQAKPSLFGQGNNAPLFGGISAKSSEPKIENGGMDPLANNVLKPSTDLSFSALAAKNAEIPLGAANAGVKAAAETAKNFNWAGAGTPLFGGSKETKPKASLANESQEEVQEADTEYDPYYEPIIPMPDTIEVVTGEEDEVVKFEERGKLYRFSGTEWKERATGSMRLLYHPNEKSYRLLMRQNQVHKVVLNLRVTRDFQMMPMAKSERAFMWAGLNFTPDSPSGELERLAIRFGKEDQGKAFSGHIDAVVKELQERHELEGSQEEEKDGHEDSGEDHEEYGEDQEEYGEHEEYRDDDEEYGDDNEEHNYYQYEDYKNNSEGGEDDHHEYEEEYINRDHSNESDIMKTVFECGASHGGRSVQVIAGPSEGYVNLYDGEHNIHTTTITKEAYMKQKENIVRWAGVGESEQNIELPSASDASKLLAAFNSVLNKL